MAATPTVGERSPRARHGFYTPTSVPNHMGVSGNENLWWWDVMEWGRSSPYADFFDIDWDPPDGTLRGRVLAPVLVIPMAMFSSAVN